MAAFSLQTAGPSPKRADQRSATHEMPLPRAGASSSRHITLPSRKPHRYLSLAALIAALFISLTQVVGWSFAQASYAGSLEPASLPLPVFVGAWLVLACVSYVLILLSFDALDWLKKRGSWRGYPAQVRDTSLNLGRHGRGELLPRDYWFYRHCFLCSFVILCLAWGVWLCIYFPGTLPFDGARSMSQFITDTPLQNHHPVLMNALYAGLMSLGRFLHSDNLGLLLVVSFQFLFCALVFAGSVRMIYRLGAPRGLIVAILCFFALCPLWGLYAQAAFKDTLFNGIFLLFMLCLAHTLRQSRVRYGSWFLLLAAALLVCFTRNNGIYVVIPSLLALAGFFLFTLSGTGKQTRSVIGATSVAGISLVMFLLVMNVAWPALGIDTNEAKETLSVPFQQTARYVALAPDEITTEEQAAIDTILPYDELDELYNPSLSDPVKEALRSPYLSREDESAYLAAWLAMGLRHPGIYLEATLANTYGYFYPWIIIGPQADISRVVFPVANDGLGWGENFDVYHVMPEALTQAVSDFLYRWLELPLVNVVFSPAIYVLIFIVLVAYGFRKRDARALVLCLPCIMLLVTVLAGPLNGHLRYLLPVVASLPLLTGFFIREPLPE